MLDHYLQRSMVYRLALTNSLRFSELKPDTIENKLFTYHLKKVVAAGLVAKQENGTYALTPEGRRLGTRVLDKQLAVIDQPESVLFLAVRRKSDKAWLLYRRKTHPLLGKIGFMHCTPRADTSTEAEAAKACRAKTGLKASFTVLGGGYFRVFRAKELESFTHYTLLVSNDAEGELEQNDEFAEYFWTDDPNFADVDMLPNMKLLGELHAQNQLFFQEATLHIS
jgi:hypothetical protein